MKQAAAKFARTQEGLLKGREMYEENQRNRADPKKREDADCVWLMQVQATRPGSDADNKGVGQYFGQPMSASDITEKEGKVTLTVKGKELPIKDKKARAEIMRRVANNEPLHDSGYWLKSHGATTLEGRHVVEKDGDVYLEFIGKESVWHSHKVRDHALASMLLDRKQKAGDTGKLFGTDYSKVGAYAKTLDGGKFTPKDFRTQRATSLAIESIKAMPAPKDEKEYKASVKRVGEVVSSVLGNEPAQALQSYIDPNVFAVWRPQ